MSLVDLLKLIRHYWAVVIASIIVCLICVVVAFVFLIPNQYKATSTVSAFDPSGTVLTSELLSTVESLSKAATVEASRDGAIVDGNESSTASSHFSIVAISDSPEVSIQAANFAANKIATEAKEVYNELEASIEDRLSAYEKSGGLIEDLGGKQIDTISRLMNSKDYSFCTFNVQEAYDAVSTKPSMKKLLLAGGLAGLFIGVCIVALINLFRRPIKSIYDIKDVCDDPILEHSNQSNMKMMWANTVFALGKVPKSLCILPVKSLNKNDICAELEKAIQETGNRVVLNDERIDKMKDSSQDEVVLVCCSPIKDNVRSAWAAKEAEATIICVEQWKDELKDFIDTRNELKLAKADIAGIFFQNK